MSLSQIFILIKRLAIVMGAYTLCRIFFLAFNPEMIHVTSKLRLLFIFIYGIRFDVFSILITNALFILLHLVPLKWFLRKNYQLLLKIVFFVFNIPAILLNRCQFDHDDYSLNIINSPLDELRPQVAEPIAPTEKYTTQVPDLFTTNTYLSNE